MLNLKNLGTRALTGVGFVAILAGGILYNEYSFVLVFSIITVLAIYEFYGLLNQTIKDEGKINKTLNTVGGLLLFLSSYGFFSDTDQLAPLFAIYVLYLLVLFSSELFLKKKNPIISLAYSALGQIYVALPMSLLCYLAFRYDSDQTYHYALLLALFVFIWVNDSFAYLFGSMLGKHRMFERVSPKKSWEGFAGGAMSTIVIAIVYANYFTQLPVLAWVGFAVTLIVFGTLGDLIESLFKRTLGVKDSGNILPGHGGLLDRIDSVIFGIPALFVYLEVLMHFYKA